MSHERDTLISDLKVALRSQDLCHLVSVRFDESFASEAIEIGKSADSAPTKDCSRHLRRPGAEAHVAIKPPQQNGNNWTMVSADTFV